MQRLTHVCLMVEDQDEAKQWYMEKLGWEVRVDAPCEHYPGGRWLTMGLPEQPELEITLHPIPKDKAIREQMDERFLTAGHSVGWVFESKSCIEQVEQLRKKGVEIIAEPDEQKWGTHCAFADLYGNHFVLVEHKK